MQPFHINDYVIVDRDFGKQIGGKTAIVQNIYPGQCESGWLVVINIYARPLDSNWLKKFKK